jgi:hypothetical protein
MFRGAAFGSDSFQMSSVKHIILGVGLKMLKKTEFHKKMSKNSVSA